MDGKKKNFTTYCKGTDITDQFYLDEDFNVPDIKRDVQRVLLSDGKIQIEDMKCVENYIRVNGKILFHVLYVTDEGDTKIAALEGKMPFEEMIYTDEKPLEHIFVKESAVNVSVNVIHSRKLNIKAVVELKVATDGQKDMELLLDVPDQAGLYKKYKEETVLVLKGIKKDTYRVKEEITIGGTKESVGNLLWNDVVNRKLDTRISEDEIHLQGELLLFSFYESVDGKTDWIEQAVPYQGKIGCYGVQDSMYHEVYPQLKDIIVEMKMDEDGEMRILLVEATLEIRIVLYEEEKIQLLDDLYSLEKRCDIERKNKQFEQILMQNHSKCKVTERLSLPEIKDNILQICHSSAQMQIDHSEVTEKGIQIEGVLHVSFLYVKPDDVIPFDVWQGMIPFTHFAECNTTPEDMSYELAGSVEQLAIGLLGNDEIEVKAVLAIRSFVRKQCVIEDIEEISYVEQDTKGAKEVPGIIGYIVKDEDNLWDLAKKYNTTMESIINVNNLETSEVKIGQKILIFRENMSIL